MPEALATLWHHRVVQNSAVLFCAQMSRYLLPLVSVPYLARVLGPAEWGRLALAQAMMLYLLLFMDYGFALSASRAIAQHHNDPTFISRVAANVVGTKIVLAVLCLIVVFVAWLTVPALADANMELLIWIAAASSVVQAFLPSWYFLGVERLMVVTALDVLSKVVATALIFVIVQQHGDAWKVLASYGIAGLGVTTLTLLIMYRDVPFRVGRPKAVIQTLCSGWHTFLYRMSVNLYTSSNILVLGIVAPAPAVGFYAGADRISKATIGLMEPANQALFPRASRLTERSALEANRFIRRALLGFGAAGLASGALLFATAPRIVLLAFGSEFEPSVPLLRVLALLLPILGLSIPLGYCWILPFGLEARLARLSIVAGFLFLPMAFVLGSRFGGLGVAWSLILTELGILIRMGWLYRAHLIHANHKSEMPVPAIAVSTGAGDGS